MKTSTKGLEPVETAICGVSVIMVIPIYRMKRGILRVIAAINECIRRMFLPDENRIQYCKELTDPFTKI